VRILHTLDHPNVVHFYEWYETDNHLWCIEELCTGGMLEDIIVQDGHLPEESIQEFGADLLAGLSYIHSMGVVLCELNPAKILLDNGVLKYFDFANARLPSNLDRRDGDVNNDPDDSELEFDANGMATQEARYGLRHKQKIGESQPVIGNPLYMAPEVMQGQMCSSASDLWSLGCVLYELYYGIPPFSGQTFEEVLHRTLNEVLDEFPAVEDKVPPSREFQDLLSGLLIKDPTKRMAWPELVRHPFWGNSLLLPDSVDKKEQNPKTSDTELQNTSKTKSKIESETRIKQPDWERPLTAPFQYDSIVKEATFALSGTRPYSALPVTMMKTPESIEQTVQSHVSEQHQRKMADLSLKDEGGKANGSDETVLNVRKLIFHSSDLDVLPIFGNSKIHKLPSFKWDPRVLPFQAIEVETLKKMDPAPLDSHLIPIERALVSSSSSNDTASPRITTNSSRATSSGSGSKGKLHIAAYLCCICQDTELANHVVNSPLFNVVLSLVRAPKTASDLRFRLVIVLGNLARHSTLISQDLDLSEVNPSIT
jgi:serine/threonine-protein kinase ULK4